MTKHEAGQITWRNPTDQGELTAVVYDNSPALAAHIHVEGRKVVEVSVELFMELMAVAGYFPVNPTTDEIVIPERKDDDPKTWPPAETPDPSAFETYNESGTKED